MEALELQDVRKSYGNREAVHGISLTVHEGEIFGLIGHNGAGKTTTLRMISTLLRITSGSISVFGHDVAAEPDEVRRIISYLPEDAGAYKDLTGRQYMEFMASFFASGEEKAEMVRKGIELADLGERIDSKVDTYSKGMMRRLLIARAIMPSPRLAIMDEVTSGLDVINAYEVREVIMGLPPSVEGDATSIYLARTIKPLGVRTTRLASGVPVGSKLEQADRQTIFRALEGRHDL